MWEWFNKLFLSQPEHPKSLADLEVDVRALELVALGDKMFAAEDFEGAIEAYESALRLDGHCAVAWFRRGLSIMREERLLQAGVCYMRALELDPKLADAWRSLGETILNYLESDKNSLFIRENRVEIVTEANDCFERAIKLNGDIPNALEGRDKCHDLLRGSVLKRVQPPLFSFHSGGILEEAKREVVSPFLKPGDYRRKNFSIIQDD